MKYNIMHEYSSEGFSFYCEGRETTPKNFDTVGEALMFGMELGYSTKFIIVSLVDYKKLVLGSDLNNPIN